MLPATAAQPAVSPTIAALPCVLVMPAYNEEGCIAAVVAGWVAEFERLFGDGFRFVIVDDGSRDRTGNILDALAKKEPRLQVVHQANAGHGGALLRAYREALALNPAYVFHVDSDDQFRPRDFAQLWDRRGDSACILGHRIDRHDALHRLVITRILRLVLLALYGCYLKDSNIPYRLLEAGFLRRALGMIPPDAFAPNIFIAVIGARNGCDLMHLPVTHEDRKTGSVSIVRWKLIRVCFRCVRELLAFRSTLAACAGSRRSGGAGL